MEDPSNPHFIDTPAHSALTYLFEEWPILPLHSVTGGQCTCGKADCNSPGKHPRTEHGLQDATVDFVQVHQWWKDWPEANVGIRTGTPGGIVVLDVDGDDGTTSLRTFETQFGPLPDTRCARTGRGRHLLFRTPEAKIINRAGVLAPGLDIRGHGGYIVAPPSRHVSGAVYSWDDWQVPIAPMPGWLLDLTRASDPTPKGEIRPLKIAGECTPYGRRALEAELERLIQAQPGERNDTLNLVSFRLGQLVGGGELSESLVTEETTVIALSRGLGEREVTKTFRGALDAGKRHPREAPPKPTPVPPPVPPTPEPPTALITTNGSKRTRWTAAELLVARFPDPVWTVPLHLPEGLAMLGGRPKRGKSWLALQLSIAVATGGRFLGQEITKGKVLYYALEDGGRRLQKRMEALDMPIGVSNLILETEIHHLNDGGMPSLFKTIQENESTLVILDTFSRAVRRSGDQAGVGDMTDILGPIQHYAVANGVAFVIIDHLNKAPTKDPTTDLLGSTAKGAVPDTLWGLYRDSGKTEAVLAMTGRDIDGGEFDLRWHPLPLGWQFVGESRDVARTARQEDYLDAFQKLGECTADTLADYLGVARQTAADMCRKLYETGSLTMRKGTTKGGRPPLLYRLRPPFSKPAEASSSLLKPQDPPPPTTGSGNPYPDHLWWSED